jgi:hypothetical protein
MKMDGIPFIGVLLDTSFPRTRESRFGLRLIGLDTRFREYDGAQVTFSLLKTLPLQCFLMRSQSSEIESNHRGH